MNVNLAAWLEQEMKEFSGILQTFKKKQKSKAPLWMAVCLFGMVAIGFAAGYDISYIMRVHFPIGCGIALFAGLCFWLPSKVSNIKAVQDGYEKAIEDFFQSQEEQDRFVRQMESGSYDKVNFFNVNVDTFPARFIVGPDFWLYFNGRTCQLVRTEDILSIRREVEKTRVNTGGNRAKKIAVGVSMVITYKHNSVSANKSGNTDDSLFFHGEQYEEVLELIKKQCPQYHSWIGN